MTDALKNTFTFFSKKQYVKPKALGVLLCYNDADMLKEQIEYLLAQNHDIIAWDHGSDDETSQVLDKYDTVLKQRKFVPRDFDFYKLYPAMSENLIENFIDKYDFISRPDQDEFLEGPKRDKNYYDYITDVYNSKYTYIEFQNFVYWYTKDDDLSQSEISRRIIHYSLFEKCSPRIRAWKAKVTNTRVFNHNPLDGIKYPHLFRLRHYPVRSEEHLYKRLNKDRVNLERNGANYHYSNMKKKLDRILEIKLDMFHIDNGYLDLNPYPKFNWDIVYGIDIENIVQIVKTVNSKDTQYDRETPLPLPAMNLSYYTGTDNYSDGDVEERILHYICNNEPETYSHIFSKDSEWAVFYHLTQFRKNLLNWYTFKEGSSLLEIGAGMGALTSLFCERCAYVTAVEMSKRRAEAVQIRCRNYKNLDIVVGDFTKMQFEKKYDYITLIGVLEYQSIYGTGDTPQLDFLNALKKLLAPGGKIIVAIENKFGLKYWTGEGDDHSGIPFGSVNDFAYGGAARTFDRQELSALLAEAGFKPQKFYYPLPDYKLPRLIYSDEYISADILSEACPLYYDRNQYGEIPVVIDESKVREPVVRNGVFPFFANSFLVECLLDGGSFDDTVFVSIQAGVRAKKYQIITRFNGKQFIKSAVYPEAVPHIQQCYNNIVELQNHGIPVVEHNFQQGIITAPAVSLQTVDQRFINMLKKHDVDGAAKLLDKLYGYILQSSEKAEAENNYVLETSLVPEGEAPDFGVILKTAHCDMTLFNCFCEGDDFLFFDQEWKFPNLPAGYVLFRAIVVMYFRNQFLEKLCPIQYWKTRYDLESLWPLYTSLEVKLLSPVTNTELQVIWSLSYMPPEMIQNNISLLQTGHERLHQKQEELRQMQELLRCKQEEHEALINSRTYRTMKILHKIAKRTGVITVLKGVLKIRRKLRRQKIQL